MDETYFNIRHLLQVAGAAQIALVTASLAIPKVLRFKEELAKVQPLIKQMFWTYAGYILVTNFCFGLVSLLGYNELVNGSVLATFVSGFIAVYWISRVLVQFFYFDRPNIRLGFWLKLAEVLLVTLFIFLSLVYAVTFYLNFRQI